LEKFRYLAEQIEQVTQKVNKDLEDLKSKEASDKLVEFNQSI